MGNLAVPEALSPWLPTTVGVVMAPGTAPAASNRIRDYPSDARARPAKVGKPFPTPAGQIAPGAGHR